MQKHYATKVTNKKGCWLWTPCRWPLASPSNIKAGQQTKNTTMLYGPLPSPLRPTSKSQWARDCPRLRYLLLSSPESTRESWCLKDLPNTKASPSQSCEAKVEKPRTTGIPSCQITAKQQGKIGWCRLVKPMNNEWRTAMGATSRNRRRGTSRVTFTGAATEKCDPCNHYDASTPQTLSKSDQWHWAC